jgi:hypothetical protein
MQRITRDHLELMNTCPDGLAKDPFNTASGVCPLTYSVLAGATYAWLVTNVLFTSLVAYTIYIQRFRMVLPWASAEMVWTTSVLIVGLLYLPALSGLAQNPSGMDELPIASRGLLVSGWLLHSCVTLAAGGHNLVKMVANSVHALDLDRRRALARIADLTACSAFIPGIGSAVGWSMCLFGSDHRTQNTGVIVTLIAQALTAVGMSVVFNAVAQQLENLLAELGDGAQSMAEIREMAQGCRRQGAGAIIFVAANPILAALASTRALYGIITIWWYAWLNTFSMAPACLLFMYGFKRDNNPATKSANKVHAGEDGSDAIATFTAAATKQLPADAPALEAMAELTQNSVSLHFLHQFAKEFDIGSESTAQDVCTQHVKPTTVAAQTSLVTLLQGGRDGNGALWCNTPTHFISYAWSYRFRLLLDIVAQHEEENPPPAGQTNYYFLDRELPLPSVLSLLAAIHDRGAVYSQS